MIFFPFITIFLFVYFYYNIIYREKDDVSTEQHIDNEIIFNLYNHINNVDEILKCKFKRNIHSYNLQIPVFILNRDRLYAIEIILNKLFRLQKIYKIKIYILDHYSTYKPTINYLYKLEKQKKIEIIKLRMKKWRDMIYREIPKLIKNITAKNRNDYYILTDSDICLDYIPDDFINLYIYLLISCKGIDVIGPHITVSSISNNYPKKNWAYNLETNYSSKTHYDIYWKNSFYSLVASPIDTTFQVRRSKVLFRRLKGKIFRSLPPYIILHTDYYINTSNIPQSYLYYVNSSKGVNHSYWK